MSFTSNTSLHRFLSKKIRSGQSGHFSQFVSGIAVGSIALGLAVLIVLSSIFQGFQEVILEKITSLTAHIQITKYDSNQSFEESPLDENREFFKKLKGMEGIANVQSFIHKPALLRSKEEVNGVVLKGIQSTYDTSKLHPYMLEGYLGVNDSSFKNSLIISKKISDQLHLSVGDKALLFFVQNPPRYRKVEIRGIYETAIEDYDELFVLCDQELLQKINGWEPEMVSGVEMYLHHFDDLEEVYAYVGKYSDPDMYPDKVTHMLRHFFVWFQMLERNLVIFMMIILGVVLINIIAVLLIMITERTEMIGLLKALGAKNGQIRRVFISIGSRLLLKGLLWGNGIGLLFCVLEDYLAFLPLDPENYYMDHVPIGYSPFLIIFFNILVAVLVSLILFIPTYSISRMKPIRAIRFD